MECSLTKRIYKIISNGNPHIRSRRTWTYIPVTMIFVITHIRTQWGMPLPKLGNNMEKNCTNTAYVWPLRIYNIRNTGNKNDTLKLTCKGVFISDGIMSDMFGWSN